MFNILVYLIIGLAAGALSGLIGIGGGVIIIPALVFLLGFSQLQAQGTTLALMVPPIGILAALTYYNRGLVDLKVAVFICLGFLFGGLIGAKVAVNLPNIILQRIFGVALLIISLKMIFVK
ncbi:MAG: sulfite exporter TauE/SafE family protein [Candidatus Omnitrophota bacterium]